MTTCLVGAPEGCAAELIRCVCLLVGCAVAAVATAPTASWIATRAGRVSLEPRLGVPANSDSPRRPPVPVAQVRMSVDDHGATTTGTQRPRTKVRVTPLWWLTSADRFRCRLVGPATPRRRSPRSATQPVKPSNTPERCRSEVAARPGRFSRCGQAGLCSWLISSRSSRRSPLPGCPSRRQRSRCLGSQYKTVRTPWNCS